MSACKSCGAAVRWAWTGERFMPIDADPRPDGNVVPTGGIRQSKQGSAVPVVRYDSDDSLPLDVNEPDRYDHTGLQLNARYVSHFATCNDPERWRRS